MWLYIVCNKLFDFIWQIKKHALQRHNEEFFRAVKISWNKATLIKISSQTYERKALQGRNWESG